MEKVIREMLRETINSAINSMINNYMRNRVLNGKPDEDAGEPLSNSHSLDPIYRAARSILDDFLRAQIKELIREELLTDKKGSFLKGYMIEASFISYFNNKMLRPILRQIAFESMAEM